MTKTLIASLIAVGFATSAFASDASEVLHQDAYNQAAVTQTQHVRGSEAYAYAPSQYRSAYSTGEQREFDRATDAALSR